MKRIRAVMLMLLALTIVSEPIKVESEMIETNDNKLVASDNKNKETEVLQMNLIQAANNILEDIKKETTDKEYILIGDSRFVGMNIACDIDSEDNKTVIAKVGEGHKYLKDIALPKAEELKTSNTAYIICLGVNDLYNLKKYKETYEKLINESDTIELYLVSVNPVEYHEYISNKGIEKFNTEIIDFINNIESTEQKQIYYIDTYYKLIKQGYKTVDGVHYTNETYKNIYNIINENLN